MEDAKRLELLSVLPRQFSKLLPYHQATHPLFFLEERIVFETNRINYNLLSKQLHEPSCFAFHWMRHKDSNLRHAQSKCAVLPTELYLNLVRIVRIELTISCAQGKRSSHSPISISGAAGQTRTIKRQRKFYRLLGLTNFPTTAHIFKH